jgi:nucleotidyltransferase substrate binding protein (TIGR01987 family)
MEKIEALIRDTKRALETFKEILDESFSVIVRDAAIQRFEYSFEVIWKLLKEYLKEKEGIICNSPKSCFREAFNVHILDEEETIKALEMTDDRNLTSHAYIEKVAQKIYERLSVYLELNHKIFNQINKNLD